MGYSVALILSGLCLICLISNAKGYTASVTNRNEFTYYTFSCNSGYFISVYSATFIECSTSYSVSSALSSIIDGHQSYSFYISDSSLSVSGLGCTGQLSAYWYCGINGGWSDWGSWSHCVCGGGTVTRTRTCSNPTLEYPGSYCSGDSSETAACTAQNCNVAVSWTKPVGYHILIIFLGVLIINIM